VDLLAGREGDLVEHREVLRVHDEEREAPVGEHVGDRVVAVRDLGLEEPGRVRVEPHRPGERGERVLPAEGARERLLAHRLDLEEVRAEPAAEDDLVLERVAQGVGRARALLHQHLAEAGRHGRG